MIHNFWVIAVVFNPAGYRSRIENYSIFRDRLASQNINLFTVELALPGRDFLIPKDDRVLHLRGGSVLWQKERLINVALSRLPPECDRLAWIDTDLLLPDGWAEKLMAKLDRVEFVQLFEEIHHLRPGERTYGGPKMSIKQGVVWQKEQYGDYWRPQRQSGAIQHAEPGFGWAARRDALPLGLYDRLILGSGDNFLCDCLLGSFHLPDHSSRYTSTMVRELESWQRDFLSNVEGTYDYLPLIACHLWHGSLRNRGYRTRDRIYHRFDYQPQSDIRVVDEVWQWASDKPELHRAVEEYFRSRREDDLR